MGSIVSGLIGGIGSIFGGSQTQSATNTAISQQDPLSQYRQYFANQLYGLYQNPSQSIAQNPQYQFNLQQGDQNLQRSASAQGNLYSGNTLAALQTYGQNTALSTYAQDLSQLGALATGNPAFANISLGGSLAGSQQTQAGIGGVLGSLFGSGSGGSGGLGGLLGGLFGGGGSSALSGYGLSSSSLYGGGSDFFGSLGNDALANYGTDAGGAFSGFGGF